MIKNLDYYQKESQNYSDKRYPEIDTDYVHFFFKRRLDLLVTFLDSVLKDKADQEILEVGCADGIVARSMMICFDNIKKINAIDVSESMIETAKLQTKNPKIAYYVRGKEPKQLYDIVVEIGVVNLTDREVEYKHALETLKPGGLYICSLATRTSLRSILKFNENNDGFAHLLSFEEYEKELMESFEIVRSTPYGLFIPLLWKAPSLARCIQPFLDKVLSPLEVVFHEKIYLLRKR
ncbi:MAG: Methyltransferase domain [Candidatus Parcubacteria bacterium]|jgi:SAM-dependent methyltransferase